MEGIADGYYFWARLWIDTWMCIVLPNPAQSQLPPRYR